MKNKLLILGVVMCAIGGTSLSIYAQTQSQTPGEVLSNLTGRTVDELREERVATGKSYGMIADELNQLDEFKAQNLEIQKGRIYEQVSNGELTEQEAENVINRIEENQALCDGTGQRRFGFRNENQGNKLQGQGRNNRACMMQ